MSEYIKREDALDKFKRMPPSQTKEFIIETLNAIPAADVEPVVREECEYCSTKVHTTDDGQPFSQEWYLTVNGCRFCPQCGRKLNMERSGSGE